MIDSNPKDLPFDVEGICEAIKSHGYKRVVLQFPDEHLKYCAPVYEYMLETLNPATDENDSWVDVFISADSTYGSSVDDVSADHVDAEILVYFGSDLSSSGTMPVIVAPKHVTFDVEHCCQELEAAILRTQDANNDSRTEAGEASLEAINAIVLFEPGCAIGAAALHAELQSRLESGTTLHLAQLPAVAMLDKFNEAKKEKEEEEIDTSSCNSSLGGLEVPTKILADTTCILIYVGDKASQIQSVTLQLGLHQLLAYSPITKHVEAIRGDGTRPFSSSGVLTIPVLSASRLAVGDTEAAGENTPTNAEISIVVWMNVG